MDNQADKETKEVIQGVDPVSGNDIPVGSSAKEVRDDVDAKLSENEYVIPADVVRFYGVNHFEKLINKAKEGYAKMVEDGRFGDSSEEDEELPFSDEELMTEDMPEEDEAPVEMNEGGLVKMAEGGQAPASGFNPNQFVTGHSTFGGSSNPIANFGSGIQTKTYINANGEKRSIMFSNGVPIQEIPDGFVEDTPDNRDAFAAAAETQNQEGSDIDDRSGRREEEDYGGGQKPDYASMTPEQREMDAKIGRKFAGLVGGMMGGPLGAKAAQGLVSSEQRRAMEEQGISHGEIEEVLGKPKEGPIDKIKDGFRSVFGDERNKNDIIGAGKEGNEGKTSKPDFDTPDSSSKGNSGNSGEGGSYGYGSGNSEDKDESKKSSSFNKGGLVKRRPTTKKKNPGKRVGLATRK